MDAYLICPETHKSMWLGKAIRVRQSDGTETVNYFHQGAYDDPPNYENEMLNKVLWKFLAEHTHKELRIVFSGEVDDESFDRVGTDDVEADNYLRDWPQRGAVGRSGASGIDSATEVSSRLSGSENADHRQGSEELH